MSSDERIKIDWSTIEKYSDIPIEYRFIDYAEIIPGRSGEGVKNASSQDWYYRIHFPGNPVMPGVFIMEAIQQTAMLIVTTMPGMSSTPLLFCSCKNMRLYHSVRPGMVLKTKVTMKSFRHGVAEFHGEAYVDDAMHSDLICIMDFVLVKSDATVKVRTHNEDMLSEKKISDGLGGVEISFNEMSQYLADPDEYRFVDSVYVYPGEACKGSKNISFQEWYLQICSKDRIFPNAFIMESILQTGVFTVTSLQETKDPLMMFNSCKDLYIYDIVRPGDRLVTLSRLQRFQNGVAMLEGQAMVNGKIVCSMRFILICPSQIQKVKS